jgi:hypothetical protein
MRRQDLTQITNLGFRAGACISNGGGECLFREIWKTAKGGSLRPKYSALGTRARIYRNIFLNRPESRPIFCLGRSALFATFFGFRAILKQEEQHAMQRIKAEKRENSPRAAACP